MDRYPAPPHPLPRTPTGWYALLLSHEVAAGEVREVHACDRELVVFRTAAGVASVLDATCPHLGANLAVGGVVERDCLRCPFHKWGFGADGACVDIPYAKKIPAAARTRAYPVREQNGVILAWVHPADAPPAWEPIALPTAGWSETTWVEYECEVHIQDVAENGIDIGHFPVLHDSRRSSIEVIDAKAQPFRFVLRTAYEGGGIGVPGQTVDVTTHWSYHDLGNFLAESLADRFGTRIRQLFHFTPMPGNRLRFRSGMAVDLATIPASMVGLAQKSAGEITVRNLKEDAPIWRHKKYPLRPPLVGGDGPYGLLRRWSRRFYPAIAGIDSVEDDRGADVTFENIRAPLVRPVAVAAPVVPVTPTAAVADAPAIVVEAAVVSPDVAPAIVVEAPVVSPGAVRQIFFEKVPRDFRPGAVAREFVVQYLVEGPAGGSFVVDVGPERCAAREGTHPTPDVTVNVSDGDWLRIHARALDGAEAFMTGKLRLAGNFELAVKLGEAFPV